MVVGLLAPTNAAAAQQLDAFDRPRVFGPLTLDTRDCGLQRTRNAEGDVVALAKSCLNFYVLEPENETNRRRDYGIVWVQTNVNARRNWCTTSVRGTIKVPRRARLHQHSPGTKRVSSRRRVLTRLVATAQDSARRVAKIRRRYLLYSDVLRGRPRDGRRSFQTRWRGSSTAKLAFVSAIEVSWRSGQGPPKSVRSTLNYQVLFRRNC
ncbi:MAG TPA: hypothetical protein VG408_05100 [Actinomycetota bacterium]|nr:hypothetical protein [Actinomycetota bacterium]